MIVTCKQCATRFKLNSSLVKLSGTTVRCSGCKSVFRVYPPPPGREPGSSAGLGHGIGAAAHSTRMDSGLPHHLDSAHDGHPQERPQGGRRAGALPAAVSVGSAAGAGPDPDLPEFEEIEKLLGISTDSGEVSRMEEASGASPAPFDAASAAEDDSESLMFDLSALEIGPDTVGDENSTTGLGGPEFGSDDIFDLDSSDLEIEVVDGSAAEIDPPELEPPEAMDTGGSDGASVAAAEDSLAAEDLNADDMEDILRSLDLEDAPLDEEITEGDIISFDLLSDDGPAGEDTTAALSEFSQDEGHDDLDPQEIEALLDLEMPSGLAEDIDTPPAATGKGEAPETSVFPGEPDAPAAEFSEEGSVGPDLSEPEDPLAITPDAGSTPELETHPREAIAEGDDDAPDLDQLERMLAGEEAFLFDQSPEAADPPVTESIAAAPRVDEKEAEVIEWGAFDADATTDEIDLADIEMLLDREIAAEAAGGENLSVSDEPEDLDLDLDLDFEEDRQRTPAEADPIDGAVFGLTDLEQMLADDVDGRDIEPAQEEPLTEAAVPTISEQGPAGDIGEDTFDLSDVEKLLNENVRPPAEPQETDGEAVAQELDLEFVEELKADDDGVESFIQTLESKEIDDIIAEDHASAFMEDDDAESLDFDFDDIPEEFSGASVILEGEDGLELETLTNFGEKEAVASEAFDDIAKAPYPTAETEANVFEMGGQDDDILLPTEINGESAVGEAGFAAPARKKVRTPLVVLFVLVLLGGAGYGLYTLLDQNDISIPFVDRLLGRAPADVGDLLISLTDVNSRFTTNAKAGLLFIVTGSAKNGYDHPRSYIQVTGALKAQSGRTVKTQAAYCGNVIAEKDLETKDVAAINLRMSNRAGSNRSNVKVAAGRSVPFMLVFSDLPSDLAEFTLEPAGSEKAK